MKFMVRSRQQRMAEKYGYWTRWFAWYPIVFNNNEDGERYLVWLDKVECVYSLWGTWHYRIPKEIKDD